jgi:hypothetical protein
LSWFLLVLIRGEGVVPPLGFLAIELGEEGYPPHCLGYLALALGEGGIPPLIVLASARPFAPLGGDLNPLPTCLVDIGLFPKYLPSP